MTPSPELMQDACTRARTYRMKLAIMSGWPAHAIDEYITAMVYPTPWRKAGRWVVGEIKDQVVERELLVYLTHDLSKIQIDSPEQQDAPTPSPGLFPLERGRASNRHRYWLNDEEVSPEHALAHMRRTQRGNIYGVAPRDLRWEPKEGE